MATTQNPITIAYTEMSAPNKSPQERIGEEGMSATQYLKCAWADRLTLADQLRTEWTVTVGTFAFIIGHEYPHYSGSFVISVSCEGFGEPADAGDGLMRYNSAILTVQYEPRPFSFDGGGGGSSASEVVYEEEFGFGAEFITVPNTQLFWDVAGVADELTNIEAPGVMVRFNTWTIRFETKDTLPSALLNLVGRVNNSVITAATTGRVFPVETLLYAGPQITHRRMSDGTDLYSVALTFNDKPDGWNKFRKKATEAPQLLYKPAGAGQYKPYTPADFTTLGA